MSMSDSFVKAVKDVMALTSEVTRLTEDVKEMKNHFVDIDKRVVRLETMIEIAQQNRIEQDH